MQGGERELILDVDDKLIAEGPSQAKYRQVFPVPSSWRAARIKLCPSPQIKLHADWEMGGPMMYGG